MALIQCPECRKGVSNSAVFCPYCGYGRPGLRLIPGRGTRKSFLTRFCGNMAFWGYAGLVGVALISPIVEGMYELGMFLFLLVSTSVLVGAASAFMDWYQKGFRHK